MKLIRNKFTWLIIALISSVSALLYSSCRVSYYFIDSASFGGASALMLGLIMIAFVISIAMLLLKNKCSDKLIKSFFTVSIVLTVIGVILNVVYAFMGWEMWYDFKHYIVKSLPYFAVVWGFVVALVVIPKVSGKMKGIISAVLVLAVCFSCVSMGFGAVNFSFSAQPTVFVNGKDDYSVVWATSTNATGYLDVTVNGKVVTYIDEAQGNIRTNDKIHHVSVPQLILNTCSSYKVRSTRSIERTGYSFWSGKTLESKDYKFKAVANNSKTINIWSFSDWHEHPSLAKKVSLGFNKPDFMIMLGDAVNMVNSAQTIVEYLLKPCGDMSSSEVPVIFARGNHECRSDYSPELLSELGLDSFYFTYKLGNVSGIVLDMGECDSDSFVEYWGLADYNKYRDEEEKWLKDAKISNGEYKLAICHDDSFIETENERESRENWIKYLNEKNISLLVSGHLHDQLIREKGESSREFTTFIDGGIIDPQYYGSQITLNSGKARFLTLSNKGETMLDKTVEINK